MSEWYESIDHVNVCMSKKIENLNLNKSKIKFQKIIFLFVVDCVKICRCVRTFQKTLFFYNFMFLPFVRTFQKTSFFTTSYSRTLHTQKQNWPAKRPSIPLPFTVKRKPFASSTLLFPDQTHPQAPTKGDSFSDEMKNEWGEIVRRIIDKRRIRGERGAGYEVEGM